MLRDVKASTGKVTGDQYYCDNYVWSQVRTRQMGDHSVSYINV